LPEQLIDAETAEKKDLRQLEASLQSLWEKARLVSDVILRLKAENKELQSKLSSLELEERRRTEEIQQREQEMEDVRAQLAHAQSNGSNLFSKEESVALKLRLKELIVKINSRI
jgi:response regulator RpfG family c-di-GMP phosphodiesterase